MVKHRAAEHQTTTTIAATCMQSFDSIISIANGSSSSKIYLLPSFIYSVIHSFVCLLFPSLLQLFLQAWPMIHLSISITQQCTQRKNHLRLLSKVTQTVLPCAAAHCSRPRHCLPLFQMSQHVRQDI